MNDVNAAVGIQNLKEVDSLLKIHKSNGEYYNETLDVVDGITLLDNRHGFDSSYWIYTMKVQDRSSFMKMMTDKGVMVSRVHERNDKHTCVSEFISHLPTLDRVVEEMICIPVGWWVTEEDREYIVDCIKQGW